MGVTKECLKDIESWERFFPPSRWYHVTSSKWVVDPSGCKCLWLPPHWRTMWVLDVEFEHNFLALVGGHHQKPIIIELQPLPHSPLTHFPNISSWRLQKLLLLQTLTLPLFVFFLYSMQLQPYPGATKLMGLCNFSPTSVTLMFLLFVVLNQGRFNGDYGLLKVRKDGKSSYIKFTPQSASLEL